MHIPDGFLDARTSVVTYIASAGTVGYALYKAREELEEKRIPVLGITAAFIFAAQMLNFPVAGGTSGHFLGAILAMTLLGPFSGFLIISVVLLVQCLFFADGGLTALGANIFNMGIMGGLLSYYLLTLAKKALSRFGERKSLLFSTALFSWFSVAIASAACAIELALSRTVPIGVVLPAMVGIHSIIGIGEALITIVVLTVVLQLRPDLVASFKSEPSLPYAGEGVI